MSFALAWAENDSVIHGKVVDSETRKPIHFANVFLSNTTIGSATTLDGEFDLIDVGLGNYQLVIHHIAYETKIIPLDLLTQKQLGLTIELTPRILTGERVEIVAEREKSWRKHLKAFRESLLGKTENAKHCTLLNSEVIDFTESQGWLHATSDSLLHLRNNALGYQIDLILEEFHCTPDEKKYQVYPVFHPMQPDKDHDLNQWDQQRLKTYQGSFRHFLRAVYHQSLDSEGLELYEVKQVGNKIYTWGSTDRVKDEAALVKESDFPGLKETHFKGHYMVLSQYIPRKTDLFIEEAQKSNFYQLEFFEPCFFNNINDMALIDALGNVHTPFVFSISGHWSIYGVADLLPFDYDPDQ
ncbi:carboxypeptidase-like regulatory domain-containing protein [bacterium]